MNKLEHLAEFKRLLENYSISDSGKKLLTQVKLVLLAAPSSSGRNTVIKELTKTDKYHFIVSDTTRKPRINDGILEQNGIEYWFRSETDMLNDLKNGKFLEAAIIHNQQVSGISLRELEAAKAHGQAAITDIEIVGVQSIMSAKLDTTVIFMVPPSFEEWHRRLVNRGDMESGEYRRRLESAVEEFTHALAENYYKYVVNDHIKDTILQIDALAKGDAMDPLLQANNKTVVQKLLVDTKNHLNKL